MAQDKFVLADNITIDNTAITANGEYDIFISDTKTNSVGLPSLRVVVEYSLLTPVDIIGGINVVVESENNGSWYPIAYQFEAYINSQQGDKRIIMLQPDMSTYNDGVDSIIWFANKTEGRISRQQGKVGTSFRVRVDLVENGFGGPYAFQSVKLNILGELYD
tara:strand:+ start:136028 stop:136513 length:486 start_codon:yes stop_codon:yes gene_type:complete